MKGFERNNQLLSLCGLNCGLCTMFLGKYCPGCGGGDGNQGCKIARCGIERGNTDYCFRCTEYPCEKYAHIDEYDSFITHKNQKADLEKAERIGIEAYNEEQKEKMQILDYVLSNFNDGRKKTLFCQAAPFVIAYWRQNLESFLDAWVRTFKYFGGVTRNVIFDNARVAVKSGFGAHASAQDDYSQLAAHYGFQPVFCNPASGNEKGLVENLVGYIRRNVCVPLPHVSSLEELNGKLLEQCVKYLDHKVESKPQPVGAMLEAEQNDLRPLPKYQMDISKKGYPVVGRYSTVLFDTNHYSVPCKYRGKHTTLKAFPNTVEVWINGELVAVHDRCLGRKQESLDLQHYLPILSQKGRAIRYARPVLNTVPMEFIDWRESQHLKSKEMVELLDQCLSEGYKAVMQRRVMVA